MARQYEMVGGLPGRLSFALGDSGTWRWGWMRWSPAVAGRRCGSCVGSAIRIAILSDTQRFGTVPIAPWAEI